jgi:hypothetical protein
MLEKSAKSQQRGVACRNHLIKIKGNSQDGIIKEIDFIFYFKRQMGLI